MNSSSSHKKPKNVPTVNVHTLSEFVFCQRAGLISQFEDREDTGEEESVPNLNYLPLYDVKEIDRKIEECRQEIVVLTVVVVSVFILGLIALAFLSFVKGVFAFGLAVVVAIYPTKLLFNRFVQYTKLFSLREAYFSDEGRYPNLEHDSVEEFDWRRVIRYGFDLQKNRDPFYDAKLNIAGNPWKILRRGHECIPVFRCKPTTPKNAGPQKIPADWIYQQHHVRMAAYCEIIESSTNCSAPFGIVLFAGEFRAFAVKLTQASKKSLRIELARARRTIEARQASEPNRNLCFRCRLGSLQNCKPGETDLVWHGSAVGANSVLVHGYHKHSKCGDAFGWLPPHKYTLQKINEGVIDEYGNNIEEDEDDDFY